MSAVEERREAIEARVEEIEAIEEAELALKEGEIDEALESLSDALSLTRSTAPPVTVRIASQLLGVSQPTIRAWADEGALEDLPETSPRAVTLDSVMRVRRILEELRELGRSRQIRQALLARVDDELTLQNPDLRRSLRQMRTGTRKHYVHQDSN